MTRVLVVDDEPRIVSFVARALTAEGFRVDGAQDGLRGLDLARTGRYELVVLDLLLPGMDGVTLLRRLIDERPQQRVLVLSALSDVKEKVRCLELGAPTTCRSRSLWRSWSPGCERVCGKRAPVPRSGTSRSGRSRSIASGEWRMRAPGRSA